jgi:hypothetical protein
MSKSTKASDFLRAMNPEPAEPPPVAKARPVEATAPVSATVKEPSTSRAGLKHIGGYFDSESVEQVAILRARLKLDNSELLKLAIDDLYRKHAAKRSFGDS